MTGLQSKRITEWTTLLSSSERICSWKHNYRTTEIRVFQTFTCIFAWFVYYLLVIPMNTENLVHTPKEGKDWKRRLILAIALFAILWGGIFLIMKETSLSGERIVLISDDGEDGMIIESYRTHYLGLITSHYTMISSVRWAKTAVDSTSHLSLVRGLEPSGRLQVIGRSDAYEMAELSIWGEYAFADGEILAFSSATLTADFPTKTDPTYYRYMATGTGILSLGWKSKPMHIIVDTIIAPIAESSGLKEGTHIHGYIWGYWDQEGNFSYFDQSIIDTLAPGETYIPHQYFLQKSSVGARIRTNDFILSGTTWEEWILSTDDDAVRLWPIGVYRSDVSTYDVYSFFSNSEYRGFVNRYQY